MFKAKFNGIVVFSKLLTLSRKITGAAFNQFIGKLKGDKVHRLPSAHIIQITTTHIPQTQTSNATNETGAESGSEHMWYNSMIQFKQDWSNL